MPKKDTLVTCKSVFECNEADLKREYTKKWITLINRLEQNKRTLCAMP